MSSDLESRVAVLRGANERKSERAREAALRALLTLATSGSKVNVNAVAREAGISRGFIYAHEDLRCLVAEKSEESKSAMRRATPSPNVKSLTARLAIALREIEKLKDAKKKLEQEKAELSARVESLTAQLFERDARRL
ncbi:MULTISPECIES: DUF6262 family protein [unclassified Microbacterium]|uniref:DUF6262 family protein n=1 Tax=unclassified Microbacterium TaxID=2609290 RepID=UPI003016464C